MARPNAETRDLIATRLADQGIVAKLTDSMFPMPLWHQSLSDRYFEPSDQVREKLIHAGSLINAESCSLVFNRVRAVQGQHCTLHAYGNPKEFQALKADIAKALTAAGMAASPCNTPHMTLSYRSPVTFDAIPIEPVTWTIDTVYLVEGGGHPYAYGDIRTWALREENPISPQLALFKQEHYA